MATYSRLLLKDGGGVIDSYQLDGQSNCATIAIGLGGTGIACLKELKKKVYARLRPDDPDSPIPEYKHIKYLAVDCDKKGLGTDRSFCSLDEEDEYFDLRDDEVVRNFPLMLDQILKKSPELQWLKVFRNEGEDISFSVEDSCSINNNANRQIGRFMIIERSEEFVNKLLGMIKDVTAGLEGEADFTIHIFTGIGGGTGSGCFLDVCYLIQEALERLNLNGVCLTLLYVFLPDVNLSLPSIAEAEPVSRHIKVNGYAAMKELDYCMNFWENHGCWDQEYKGFHIGPTQNSPTKICHLVSAHSMNGNIFRDGFACAMNVVSDFIISLLVKSEDCSRINSIQAHGKRALSILPHVVQKTTGANYCYSLIGTSNAGVPMKEIATYLASKLFEEMSKTSGRKPTDQEVNQFAEKNDLTYQQIQQALLAGTNYRMPPIDMDHKQFTNMSEEDLALADELILPEIIMKPYRDRLQSNMINQITMNFHAMTNEWSLDEIKKEQTSTSKVVATFFALRNLVIEPEFGPFYAADVLNGSQATNLVNHLRGVQKQAENDLNSARGDITLRIQAVKRTRGAFLHAGILANKKKLFDEFIAAVAAYFTMDSYIKVLEQMITMMPIMIKQFINLYDEHFKVYQTVCRNLFDTFHENYQTLSTASLTETIADPFILPLMKIEDMKESLDNAVNSMKMEIQSQNFHTFLFDKPKVWNTGDEHKISKEVSGYLVDVFNEYTGKTLTDYLEIRFNTNDPAKLTNFVYKDILEPLKDKAEALFWKAAGFDITVAQPLGYISVPDSASIILAASEKLVEVERSLSECPSKMKDRIFLLKCLCGVPMYAYNGVNDYGKEYRGDRTVGKHLYELTDRDSRDWRALSNLQPYSTDNDPSPEIEERARMYDEAMQKGIVRQNPDSDSEYQIVEWPAIDDLIEGAEKAINEKSMESMKAAADAINAYKTNKQPERIISITNDGASGHEAKVRKDHVVDSKEMSDVIRKEIVKEDKLEETLKALDAAKGGIGSGMMVKENFFNALYSGVISVNIPKVAFNEEKFGITSEVVLSEPKMEPAGKFVPLYQAYLTYKEMTEVERAKIDTQTEARLSDVGAWQAAMQDSCDRLMETFSDRYLGLMQQQATKLPDHSKDITNLLLEFRQGIDNFKLMYGLA